MGGFAGAWSATTLPSAPISCPRRGHHHGCWRRRLSPTRLELIGHGSKVRRWRTRCPCCDRIEEYEFRSSKDGEAFHKSCLFEDNQSFPCCRDRRANLGPKGPRDLRQRQEPDAQRERFENLTVTVGELDGSVPFAWFRPLSCAVLGGAQRPVRRCLYL